MSLKEFEKLAFHDDFMFGHIMQNAELCKGCLERLLSMEIDHIEYPELQKVIAPYYKSKGVRLDVYASDSSKVYDIEIQNYAQSDLGRRTRYYQSMLDIDNLMKGERYCQLKESIIIFLCRFDPFKKGIPCYTFTRTCREEQEAELKDEATIKIFNCGAYEKAENAEMKAFLKFLETDEADSDFTRRIQAMVETEKAVEELKTTYFSWGLAEQDAEYRGREDGISIGAERKACEDARNLLAMDILSHEQIAQAINLPLATINKLAEEMKL